MLGATAYAGDHISETTRLRVLCVGGDELTASPCRRKR